jgi:hypothetical protein
MGLQSFQPGARLSARFGVGYWQEARWRPQMASRPHRTPESRARLTGRPRGLAGRSGSTNSDDVNPADALAGHPVVERDDARTFSQRLFLPHRW